MPAAATMPAAFAAGCRRRQPPIASAAVVDQSSPFRHGVKPWVKPCLRFDSPLMPSSSASRDLEAQGRQAYCSLSTARKRPALTVDLRIVRREVPGAGGHCPLEQSRPLPPGSSLVDHETATALCLGLGITRSRVWKRAHYLSARLTRQRGTCRHASRGRRERAPSQAVLLIGNAGIVPPRAARICSAAERASSNDASTVAPATCGENVTFGFFSKG